MYWDLISRISEPVCAATADSDFGNFEKSHMNCGIVSQDSLGWEGP